MTPDRKESPTSYELTWAERERVAVPEGLDENAAWRFDAEHGYLHLNVHGMDRVFAAMADQGMLAGGVRPTAPEPAAFGLTTPVPHWDEDTDPRVQAFWDAVQVWLEATPDEPGIAYWKLTTNDGWYVGPDEVRAALDRSGLAKAYPDWETWTILLRFLEGAVGHGGFIVY
jgi:hypothetical protein